MNISERFPFQIGMQIIGQKGGNLNEIAKLNTKTVSTHTVSQGN